MENLPIRSRRDRRGIGAITATLITKNLAFSVVFQSLWSFSGFAVVLEHVTNGSETQRMLRLTRVDSISRSPILLIEEASVADTLDRRQVADKLGMSIRRLNQELAAGSIPPPLPLKGRRKLWSRVHLDRWLSDADDQRDVDPVIRMIDAGIAARRATRA